MTIRAGPLIAIVDDEPDIVTYLRLALEDHGYSVLEIGDAAEAIRCLEEARPNLICLDLLMPKLTGFSVYREIVHHPDLATCPVVMTSGLTHHKDLPQMLERAGGLPPPAAFVEKPISIAELIRVLQRLLGDCSEVER